MLSITTMMAHQLTTNQPASQPIPHFPIKNAHFAFHPSLSCLLLTCLTKSSEWMPFRRTFATYSWFWHQSTPSIGFGGHLPIDWLVVVLRVWLLHSKSQPGPASAGSHLCCAHRNTTNQKQTKNDGRSRRSGTVCFAVTFALHLFRFCRFLLPHLLMYVYK